MENRILSNCRMRHAAHELIIHMLHCYSCRKLHSKAQFTCGYYWWLCKESQYYLDLGCQRNTPHFVRVVSKVVDLYRRSTVIVYFRGTSHTDTEPLVKLVHYVELLSQDHQLPWRCFILSMSHFHFFDYLRQQNMHVTLVK